MLKVEAAAVAVAAAARHKSSCSYKKDRAAEHSADDILMFCGGGAGRGGASAWRGILRVGVRVVAVLGLGVVILCGRVCTSTGWRHLADNPILLDFSLPATCKKSI